MKKIVRQVKEEILKMMYISKSSHIGSCFSIVDILVTLYYIVLKIDLQNPNLEFRDKFILSKAHASAALYAVLAERGIFDKKLLDKYYIDNGSLPGHLDMTKVPGIEVSTGSLGHGLSLGIGMAIANNQSKNNGHIYVLMGDGECNEGSIWEGVMLASTLKLSNLTIIIDSNKLQGLGETKNIINQENLAERFKAFGLEVYEVDGHNHQELIDVFSVKSKQTKTIIAHTVKGKGVSFMENKLEWHYKSPNEEQYKKALEEINNTDKL